MYEDLVLPSLRLSSSLVFPTSYFLLQFPSIHSNNLPIQSIICNFSFITLYNALFKDIWLFYSSVCRVGFFNPAPAFHERANGQWWHAAHRILFGLLDIRTYLYWHLLPERLLVDPCALFQKEVPVLYRHHFDLICAGFLWPAIWAIAAASTAAF